MEPKQILDRFSSHLKNTVAKAMNLATDFGNAEVSPLHLLMILLEEQGSIATKVLKKYKIDVEYIRELINCLPKISSENIQTKTITIPNLDSMAKKIIEKSMLTAFECQHKHVGTEHLLYALVNSKDETIKIIIDKFKIDKKDIEIEII